MKKVFTILGILFLVTLVAMAINDAINKHLILSSSANSAYKMHRLFIEAPADEIGIFGSSRALLHYIPPTLSPKAFNYGFNGSTMNETLFHVKQAIRNKGTEPIIINVDPHGFPKKHDATYRFDYRLALSHPILQEDLPKELTTFKERCPGIRFHGALRKNLATYINARTATTKAIIAGASLEINSRTATEWETINARITTTDFYSDAIYQEELTAIYASTSRPIIFVVGPTAPMWRKHFIGEEKLKAFLAQQTVHKNVFVIDLYTSTANWTEEFFVDPTHLNKKGSELFSTELAKQLKSHPKLGAYFK